jgi:hypothetical protein
VVIYQVYGQENQETKQIDVISLSEGETVDIQYD